MNEDLNLYAVDMKKKNVKSGKQEMITVKVSENANGIRIFDAEGNEVKPDSVVEEILNDKSQKTDMGEFNGLMKSNLFWKAQNANNNKNDRKDSSGTRTFVITWTVTGEHNDELGFTVYASSEDGKVSGQSADVIVRIV